MISRYISKTHICKQEHFFLSKTAAIRIKNYINFKLLFPFQNAFIDLGYKKSQPAKRAYNRRKSVILKNEIFNITNFI